MGEGEPATWGRFLPSSHRVPAVCHARGGLRQGLEAEKQQLELSTTSGLVFPT